MKRFIEGVDRAQVSLLRECVDDYVEAFVKQFDLRETIVRSVQCSAGTAGCRSS